jgi:CRISPR-associated protein Csm2
MNESPVVDFSTVTPQQLNSQAEEWGRKLTEIKTHQIRTLYSAVQSIRVRADRGEATPDEVSRRLVFLKPKLAYASARQPGPAMRELREYLVRAIDGVITSSDPTKARDNFFFLMEAIVAYHKFHGGRDA